MISFWVCWEILFFWVIEVVFFCIFWVILNFWGIYIRLFCVCWGILDFWGIKVIFWVIMKFWGWVEVLFGFFFIIKMIFLFFGLLNFWGIFFFLGKLVIFFFVNLWLLMVVLCVILLVWRIFMNCVCVWFFSFDVYGINVGCKFLVCFWNFCRWKKKVFVRID